MLYKKIIAIILIAIPAFSFAQYTGDDTTYTKAIEADCDGKVFTRVETIPSVKNGNAAFADSISNYLKAKNISFKNTKVAFRILVSSKSQLLVIRKEDGNVSNEPVLKEALLLFSNLWIPAKQNSYIVCAYVRCEMEFIDDKLTVNIRQ